MDQKNTKQIYDLVICDILTARFLKIIKDKKIDVDEFVKELGGWWFVGAYNRKFYPDGSYDVIPLNRFKQFLNYESLYLPPKEQLRRLEAKLGYAQNAVCTNFADGLSIDDFLFGCGYLNEAKQPTRKFHKSPRIKVYRESKIKEIEELRKRQKANAKEQGKLKKEKQKNLFSRIREAALGQWAE